MRSRYNYKHTISTSSSR